MTITASPLTITRRNAAVSASAWFHTSDPGTFDVDYPPGITGPATVRTPEEWERVWQLGGRGGDYLARASVGQDREDVTWLIEVDWGNIQNDMGSVTNTFGVHPLIGSYRTDAIARYNWGFVARKFLGSQRGIVYTDSIDDGTNNTATIIANVTSGGSVQTREKWALTKAAGGAYVLYRAARATVAASGTRSSTGTMGGTEYLVMHSGTKCAKILRVVSDAELDAWFADGTVPASDREFAYLGGHEIDPAAPVIYDSGPNVWDLTATQIDNWQAPGMRGDFTDVGFTSPLVEIPLVIAADCAAGVHEITLRRNRVGIPDRTPPLSDAELYDDGTIPVTIVEPATWVKVGPAQEYQVYLP